jgi:hypothetical protein
MKKYWNGESKRNDEIASLTTFARNDKKEEEACNDGRHTSFVITPLSSSRGRSPKHHARHCEVRSDEAINVIARSETTKQSLIG